MVVDGLQVPIAILYEFLIESPLHLCSGLDHPIIPKINAIWAYYSQNYAHPYPPPNTQYYYFAWVIFAFAFLAFHLEESCHIDHVMFTG